MCSGCKWASGRKYAVERQLKVPFYSVPALLDATEKSPSEIRVYRIRHPDRTLTAIVTVTASTLLHPSPATRNAISGRGSGQGQESAQLKPGSPAFQMTASVLSNPKDSVLAVLFSF